MNRCHLLLVSLSLFATLGFAQVKQATPVAKDEQLEQRVNALAAELRCLVCQNQTIADSNADLAVDLKNQVRDKLRAGASDAEIIDYMVARYGDFVRYRPPLKLTTVLLWVGPFVLMVLGLVLLWRQVRARRSAETPLSDDEHSRAQALLAGGEAPTAPAELGKGGPR